MATRSNINVKVGDKYHVIYCHYDGGIDFNGLTLFNHYNSQALAEKLVSGGHLSSLDKSCDKPDGHTFKTPIKGYSVYYGRDRGDKNMEFTISDKIEDHQEYLYIWDGDKWLISGRDYDDEVLEKSLKEMNLI